MKGVILFRQVVGVWLTDARFSNSVPPIHQHQYIKLQEVINHLIAFHTHFIQYLLTCNLVIKAEKEKLEIINLGGETHARGES